MGQHGVLATRFKFNDDPAVDAAMRTARTTALSAMNKSLFDLTVSNAKAERDFALLGVAVLVAARRNEKFDLSEIEIPGQRDALAIISTIDATEARAQLIVGEMAGRLTGVDKINLGRRINAARPKVAATDATEARGQLIREMRR